MADEVESTPVKRGPGRPRKVVQEAPPEPEKVAPPSDPDDPIIGTPCDPSWSCVGYGDGTTYRCEDGFHVERVVF
jgi:hypothetical protein